MSESIGGTGARRGVRWMSAERSPARGWISADEDGLARLVLELGTEVEACVEMMSGAIWVRDRLQDAGWEVRVAHARKV